MVLYAFPARYSGGIERGREWKTFIEGRAGLQNTGRQWSPRILGAYLRAVKPSEGRAGPYRCICRAIRGRERHRESEGDGCASSAHELAERAIDVV